MKVVTFNDNSIAAIREEISYQNNGNVITDRGQAIAEILIKGVYDVAEIPSEVEEHKYCYTKEKGFYINENYKEPIDETTEISEIQLAITELYEMIEGGN